MVKKNIGLVLAAALALCLAPCAFATDSLSDALDWAEDQPSAFGLWWIQQPWTEEEQYAWRAVFKAITDEKDRRPQVRQEINDPVYVALVSGNVYHTDIHCSAFKNAFAVTQMDRTEAEERGFEKCEKCK